MKNLIRLLLLALIVTCVFKWEMVKNFSQNATEETRKYVLNLVQKPEDKVVHVVETEPPVPPPNVYYTLQRIEYPNPPYGFKAFDIGVPVRKVGEGGGKYIIEAGKERTLVDPVLLTREPKEIARLLKLTPAVAAQHTDTGDHGRSEIQRLDEKISTLKGEKMKAEAEESTARKFHRGYFGTSSLFVQNEIDRYVALKAELEKNIPRKSQTPASPLQSSRPQVVDVVVPPTSSH